MQSQIGIITDIPYTLLNSKKRAEYQGQHYNVKHLFIYVLTDGIFFRHVIAPLRKPRQPFCLHIESERLSGL